MNDSIIDPVLPELNDPVPFAPLAGDTNDDDSQVYEDDFEMTATPPQEYSGVPFQKDTLPQVTRLLTREVFVGTINGSIADPIMILPADPNRKSFTLIAYSDTQVYYTLGSDRSDCYNGVSFPTFPTTIARSYSPLLFTDHTGAIWAYSEAAVQVTVVAIAVTS